MFALDRDLITIEPNLFRYVSWLGQTLISCSGSISSGTLSISGADFTAAAITPGMVALIDGLPVEIVEVLSSTTAAVSMIRSDIAAPALPPADQTDKPISITTFAPQIALTHNQILRMLGVLPAGTSIDGWATEAQITNPHDLTLVESLGALHLIYAAASAPLGPDSSTFARAEMYRDRFTRERWRAAARIDTNNDGHPDATRRLNIMQFDRG